MTSYNNSFVSMDQSHLSRTPPRRPNPMSQNSCIGQQYPVFAMDNFGTPTQQNRFSNFDQNNQVPQQQQNFGTPRQQCNPYGFAPGQQMYCRSQQESIYNTAMYLMHAAQQSQMHRPSPMPFNCGFRNEGFQSAHSQNTFSPQLGHSPMGGRTLVRSQVIVRHRFISSISNHPSAWKSPHAKAYSPYRGHSANPYTYGNMTPHHSQYEGYTTQRYTTPYFNSDNYSQYTNQQMPVDNALIPAENLSAWQNTNQSDQFCSNTVKDDCNFLPFCSDEFKELSSSSSRENSSHGNTEQVQCSSSASVGDVHNSNSNIVVTVSSPIESSKLEHKTPTKSTPCKTEFSESQSVTSGSVENPLLQLSLDNLAQERAQQEVDSFSRDSGSNFVYGLDNRDLSRNNIVLSPGSLAHPVLLQHSLNYMAEEKAQREAESFIRNSESMVSVQEKSSKNSSRSQTSHVTSASQSKLEHTDSHTITTLSVSERKADTKVSNIHRQNDLGAISHGDIDNVDFCSIMHEHTRPFLPNKCSQEQLRQQYSNILHQIVEKYKSKEETSSHVQRQVDCYSDVRVSSEMVAKVTKSIKKKLSAIKEKNVDKQDAAINLTSYGNRSSNGRKETKNLSVGSPLDLTERLENLSVGNRLSITEGQKHFYFSEETDTFSTDMPIGNNCGTNVGDDTSYKLYLHDDKQEIQCDKLAIKQHYRLSKPTEISQNVNPLKNTGHPPHILSKSKKKNKKLKGALKSNDVSDTENVISQDSSLPGSLPRSSSEDATVNVWPSKKISVRMLKRESKTGSTAKCEIETGIMGNFSSMKQVNKAQHSTNSILNDLLVEDEQPSLGNLHRNDKMCGLKENLQNRHTSEYVCGNQTVNPHDVVRVYNIPCLGKMYSVTLKQDGEATCMMLDPPNSEKTSNRTKCFVNNACEEQVSPNVVGHDVTTAGENGTETNLSDTMGMSGLEILSHVACEIAEMNNTGRGKSANKPKANKSEKMSKKDKTVSQPKRVASQKKDKTVSLPKGVAPKKLTDKPSSKSKTAKVVHQIARDEQVSSSVGKKSKSKTKCSKPGGQSKSSSQFGVAEAKSGSQSVVGQSKSASQSGIGRSKSASQSGVGRSKSAIQSGVGQSKSASQSVVDQSKSLSQFWTAEDKSASQSGVGQSKSARQSGKGQSKSASQSGLYQSNSASQSGESKTAIQSMVDQSKSESKSGEGLSNPAIQSVVGWWRSVGHFGVADTVSRLRQNTDPSKTNEEQLLQAQTDSKRRKNISGVIDPELKGSITKSCSKNRENKRESLHVKEDETVTNFKETKVGSRQKGKKKAVENSIVLKSEVLSCIEKNSKVVEKRALSDHSYARDEQILKAEKLNISGSIQSAQLTDQFVNKSEKLSKEVSGNLSKEVSKKPPFIGKEQQLPLSLSEKSKQHDTASSVKFPVLIGYISAALEGQSSTQKSIPKTVSVIMKNKKVSHDDHAQNLKLAPGVKNSRISTQVNEKQVLKKQAGNFRRVPLLEMNQNLPSRNDRSRNMEKSLMRRKLEQPQNKPVDGTNVLNKSNLGLQERDLSSEITSLGITAKMPVFLLESSEKDSDPAKSDKVNSQNPSNWNLYKLSNIPVLQHNQHNLPLLQTKPESVRPNIDPLSSYMYRDHLRGKVTYEDLSMFINSNVVPISTTVMEDSDTSTSVSKSSMVTTTSSATVLKPCRTTASSIQTMTENLERCSAFVQSCMATCALTSLTLTKNSGVCPTVVKPSSSACTPTSQIVKSSRASRPASVKPSMTVYTSTSQTVKGNRGVQQVSVRPSMTNNASNIQPLNMKRDICTPVVRPSVTTFASATYTMASSKDICPTAQPSVTTCTSTSQRENGNKSMCQGLVKSSVATYASGNKMQHNNRDMFTTVVTPSMSNFAPVKCGLTENRDVCPMVKSSNKAFASVCQITTGNTDVFPIVANYKPSMTTLTSASQMVTNNREALDRDKPPTQSKAAFPVVTKSVTKSTEFMHTVKQDGINSGTLKQSKAVSSASTQLVQNMKPVNAKHVDVKSGTESKSVPSVGSATILQGVKPCNTASFTAPSSNSNSLNACTQNLKFTTQVKPIVQSSNCPIYSNVNIAAGNLPANTAQNSTLERTVCKKEIGICSSDKSKGEENDAEKYGNDNIGTNLVNGLSGEALCISVPSGDLTSPSSISKSTKKNKRLRENRRKRKLLEEFNRLNNEVITVDMDKDRLSNEVITIDVDKDSEESLITGQGTGLVETSLSRLETVLAGTKLAKLDTSSLPAKAARSHITMATGNISMDALKATATATSETSSLQAKAARSNITTTANGNVSTNVSKATAATGTGTSVVILTSRTDTPIPTLASKTATTCLITRGARTGLSVATGTASPNTSVTTGTRTSVANETAKKDTSTVTTGAEKEVPSHTVRTSSSISDGMSKNVVFFEEEYKKALFNYTRNKTLQKEGSVLSQDLVKSDSVVTLNREIPVTSERTGTCTSLATGTAKTITSLVAGKDKMDAPVASGPFKAVKSVITGKIRTDTKGPGTEITYVATGKVRSDITPMVTGTIRTRSNTSVQAEKVKTDASVATRTVNSDTVSIVTGQTKGEGMSGANTTAKFNTSVTGGKSRTDTSSLETGKSKPVINGKTTTCEASMTTGKGGTDTILVTAGKAKTVTLVATRKHKAVTTPVATTTIKTGTASMVTEKPKSDRELVAAGTTKTVTTAVATGETGASMATGKPKSDSASMATGTTKTVTMAPGKTGASMATGKLKSGSASVATGSTKTVTMSVATGKAGTTMATGKPKCGTASVATGTTKTVTTTMTTGKAATTMAAGKTNSDIALVSTGTTKTVAMEVATGKAGSSMTTRKATRTGTSSLATGKVRTGMSVATGNAGSSMTTRKPKTVTASVATGTTETVTMRKAGTSVVTGKAKPDTASVATGTTETVTMRKAGTSVVTGKAKTETSLLATGNTVTSVSSDNFLVLSYMSSECKKTKVLGKLEVPRKDISVSLKSEMAKIDESTQVPEIAVDVPVYSCKTAKQAIKRVVSRYKKNSDISTCNTNSSSSEKITEATLNNDPSSSVGNECRNLAADQTYGLHKFSDSDNIWDKIINGTLNQESGASRNISRQEFTKLNQFSETKNVSGDKIREDICLQEKVLDERSTVNKEHRYMKEKVLNEGSKIRKEWDDRKEKVIRGGSIVTAEHGEIKENVLNEGSKIRIEQGDRKEKVIGGESRVSVEHGEIKENVFSEGSKAMEEWGDRKEKVICVGSKVSVEHGEIKENVINEGSKVNREQSDMKKKINSEGSKVNKKHGKMKEKVINEESKVNEQQTDVEEKVIDDGHKIIEGQDDLEYAELKETVINNGSKIGEKHGEMKKQVNHEGSKINEEYGYMKEKDIRDGKEVNGGHSDVQRKGDSNRSKIDADPNTFENDKVLSSVDHGKKNTGIGKNGHLAPNECELMSSLELKTLQGSDTILMKDPLRIDIGLSSLENSPQIPQDGRKSSPNFIESIDEFCLSKTPFFPKSCHDDTDSCSKFKVDNLLYHPIALPMGYYSDDEDGDDKVSGNGENGYSFADKMVLKAHKSPNEKVTTFCQWVLYRLDDVEKPCNWQHLKSCEKLENKVTSEDQKQKMQSEHLKAVGINFVSDDENQNKDQVSVCEEHVSFIRHAEDFQRNSKIPESVIVCLPESKECSNKTPHNNTENKGNCNVELSTGIVAVTNSKHSTTMISTTSSPMDLSKLENMKSALISTASSSMKLNESDNKRSILMLKSTVKTETVNISQETLDTVNSENIDTSPDTPNKCSLNSGTDSRQNNYSGNSSNVVHSKETNRSSNSAPVYSQRSCSSVNMAHTAKQLQSLKSGNGNRVDNVSSSKEKVNGDESKDVARQLEKTDEKNIKTSDHEDSKDLEESIVSRYARFKKECSPISRETAITAVNALLAVHQTSIKENEQASQCQMGDLETMDNHNVTDEQPDGDLARMEKLSHCLMGDSAATHNHNVMYELPDEDLARKDKLSHYKVGDLETTDNQKVTDELPDENLASKDKLSHQMEDLATTDNHNVTDELPVLARKDKLSHYQMGDLATTDNHNVTDELPDEDLASKDKFLHYRTGNSAATDNQNVTVGLPDLASKDKLSYQVGDLAATDNRNVTDELPDEDLASKDNLSHHVGDSAATDNLIVTDELPNLPRNDQLQASADQGKTNLAVKKMKTVMSRTALAEKEAQLYLGCSVDEKLRQVRPKKLPKYLWSPDVISPRKKLLISYKGEMLQPGDITETISPDGNADSNTSYTEVKRARKRRSDNSIDSEVTIQSKVAVGDTELVSNISNEPESTAQQGIEMEIENQPNDEKVTESMYMKKSEVSDKKLSQNTDGTKTDIKRRGQKRKNSKQSEILQNETDKSNTFEQKVDDLKDDEKSILTDNKDKECEDSKAIQSPVKKKRGRKPKNKVCIVDKTHELGNVPLVEESSKLKINPKNTTIFDESKKSQSHSEMQIGQEIISSPCKPQKGLQSGFEKESTQELNKPEKSCNSRKRKTKEANRIQKSELVTDGKQNNSDAGNDTRTDDAQTNLRISENNMKTMRSCRVVLKRTRVSPRKFKEARVKIKQKFKGVKKVNPGNKTGKGIKGSILKKSPCGKAKSAVKSFGDSENKSAVTKMFGDGENKSITKTFGKENNSNVNVIKTVKRALKKPSDGKNKSGTAKKSGKENSNVGNAKTAVKKTSDGRNKSAIVKSLGNENNMTNSSTKVGGVHFRIVTDRDEQHLIKIHRKIKCTFCHQMVPHCDLLEHAASRHPWRCVRCSQVFNSKEEKILHFREQHYGDEVHNCLICKMKFRTMKVMERHRKSLLHMKMARSQADIISLIRLCMKPYTGGVTNMAAIQGSQPAIGTHGTTILPLADREMPCLEPENNKDRMLCLSESSGSETNINQLCVPDNSSGNQGDVSLQGGNSSSNPKSQSLDTNNQICVPENVSGCQGDDESSTNQECRPLCYMWPVKQKLSNGKEVTVKHFFHYEPGLQELIRDLEYCLGSKYHPKLQNMVSDVVPSSCIDSVETVINQISIFENVSAGSPTPFPQDSSSVDNSLPSSSSMSWTSSECLMDDYDTSLFFGDGSSSGMDEFGYYDDSHIDLHRQNSQHLQSEGGNQSSWHSRWNIYDGETNLANQFSTQSPLSSRSLNDNCCANSLSKSSSMSSQSLNDGCYDSSLVDPLCSDYSTHRSYSTRLFADDLDLQQDAFSGGLNPILYDCSDQGSNSTEHTLLNDNHIVPTYGEYAGNSLDKMPTNQKDLLDTCGWFMKAMQDVEDDNFTFDLPLLSSQVLDESSVMSKSLPSQVLDDSNLMSKSLPSQVLDESSVMSKSLPSQVLDDSNLMSKSLPSRVLDDSNLMSKSLTSQVPDKSGMMSKSLPSRIPDKSCMMSKSDKSMYSDRNSSSAASDISESFSVTTENQDNSAKSFQISDTSAILCVKTKNQDESATSSQICNKSEISHAVYKNQDDSAKTFQISDISEVSCVETEKQDENATTWEICNESEISQVRIEGLDISTVTSQISKLGRVSTENEANDARETESYQDDDDESQLSQETIIYENDTAEDEADINDEDFTSRDENEKDESIIGALHSADNQSEISQCICIEALQDVDCSLQGMNLFNENVTIIENSSGNQVEQDCIDNDVGVIFHVDDDETSLTMDSIQREYELISKEIENDVLMSDIYSDS